MDGILFIHFWLCWVFVALSRLSVVVASGSSEVFNAEASHCIGFSYWEAQALGGQMSVAVVWGLSCCRLTSLVALWHVESSWTRDWTCIPCIGKRVLTAGPQGKSQSSCDGGVCAAAGLSLPSILGDWVPSFLNHRWPLYSLASYIPCKENPILFRFFPIEIITYRVLSKIPCAIQ